MLRLLIRAPERPGAVVEPLASTSRIGSNLGNLLYINGVYRALSTESADITAGAFRAHALEDPTDWLAKVNRRYDRFVIPMSNAFRVSFSEGLEGLTRIVEGLDMPVTVVGVGAQAPVDAVDPETGRVRMGRTGSSASANDAKLERHDDVVRRFVKAVLERSESIGVRGHITQSYLVSLGFDPDRVDVIGCPSLYTWGPDLQVSRGRRPVVRRSRVSINVDFRVAGMGEIVERNTELYPRLTSPVQDSGSARMIITGEDTFDLTKRDPRTPIHTGHRLYREGRLLYYPSPWAWIDSMKKQRFAFGSRLHGNIAALLAGTPAHLLAHDTRTLELAEYHGIPHSMIDSFDTPPTAAELYERSDFSEFNELQPKRFATYLEFLHRNGFETVFDDGHDASAFDASIKKSRRTKPVVSGKA